MARCMIIGGTGVISAPCVQALLAAGHQVEVIVRGTDRPTPVAAGVDMRRCDRNDTAALGKALAAIRPQVVVDFACFTREQAKGLVSSLPIGTRQLVFVSTVDVYGLPLSRLPMRESDPWVAPASAYAAEKRAVELHLRDALSARGTALTIVRPTYSMGGGFMISLFDRSGAELVSRLRLGLPVVLPDDGTRSIHPSDARDTGRMIAMTVGDDAAFGKDYTVGTPYGAISQSDYVTTIATALGVAPVVLAVPGEALITGDVLHADSLWLELTRNDLSYDLGRFTLDYPGFVPNPDLADAVRTYAARVPLGLIEGPEAHVCAVLRDQAKAALP